MSNDLFVPVNYDEAMPSPKPAEVPVEPVLTVEQINHAISAELQRIQAGVSKFAPHAIQIREGSTPFLNSFKVFQSEPTLLRAADLVLLARQDFGGLFAGFVEKLVSPLFKGNK